MSNVYLRLFSFDNDKTALMEKRTFCKSTIEAEEKLLLRNKTMPYRKVLLVGDPKVGKTSTILTYCTDLYHSPRIPCLTGTLVVDVVMMTPISCWH